MERVWREAAAVSPEGLSNEDRITRDILQVVAEIAIEADDLAYREILVVDQMQGAADAARPAGPVPAGGHARASRRVPVADPRVRGVHGRPPRHHGRRPALGADGRPDRRGAERSSSSSASSRSPSSRGSSHGPGRRGRGTRQRSRDAVREVVYPADRRLLEALRGAYYPATREQPGLLSGAGRGDALPARDPAMDVVGPGARGRPPGGARRAGLDQRRATGDRGVRKGFGNDLQRVPQQAGQRPRQPGRRRPRRSSPARTRTSSGPGRGGPPGLRPPPPGRLRGPAGRGVQGEGRAVRVLPRRRPTRRGRASTTSTPTTCRAAPYSKLASTTFHEAIPATTSRSAWRWNTPA